MERVIDSVQKIHECVSLFAPDLSDRRNTPAVFLDGCDPGTSQATKPGAHFLLSLRFPSLFFRQRPVRAQRPSLLRNSSERTHSIRMVVFVFRAVVRASTSSPFACGIRFPARVVGDAEIQDDMAPVRMGTGTADESEVVDGSAA